MESDSHCQLHNGSAGRKRFLVYLPAPPVFFEQFHRFAFIAVDLPAAYAFAVMAGVFDKADHIFQWIAQKDTNFMRKFFLRRKPVF